MKTKDLENYLRESSEFDERTIADNLSPSAFKLIDEYLDKSGIRRSELIKRLNFDRNYGYQILNGTRMPTRVYLIKIGLFLELELEQMQQLLQAGGKEILYVRNMEDARTIYAIEHKLDYDKAAEFIWNSTKS